jgi:capsular polysaccharide biosynthesis protein
MADSGLKLTDVIESIRKHKKLVIIITAASALAGAIFHLAGPKKYEAKTEFIIRNPLYGDRNSIYNYETKFIDYFGNEDDADRIMIMAGSDMVQSKVIKNMNLAAAYNLDENDPKSKDQLERKFNKNFNITRTEYKDVVLSYMDTDPARAAAVANECVKVLEAAFGGFYKDMRVGMYQSINEKIKEEDSSIDALTDTLSSLRDQSAIYDIISPSRFNLMLGSMKDNGHKNYGKAVELIQNYESLKDELVSDRAKQATLVNQFTTGNKMEELPMIKVVTPAKIPISAKGIGGLYTMLACALLGFFFSAMVMSFADSYLVKQTNKS